MVLVALKATDDVLALAVTKSAVCFRGILEGNLARAAVWGWGWGVEGVGGERSPNSVRVLGFTLRLTPRVILDKRPGMGPTVV